MARDYAQRRNSKKRNHGKSGVPGSVTLLLGLTIGLMIAAGVYISVKPATNGYQKQTHSSTATPPPVPAQQAGKAAESASASPATAAPPATDKPASDKPERFSFYDMLPNYEIVPYEAEPKAERPQRNATTPGNYVIQAGSFTEQDRADRLKARMALLGIESHIQSGTGPSGITRYRVRVGPVSDVNRVNDILKTLREHNIRTLLMRGKG